MALKPLNDRIIIEPSEAETRTASGLVLPDSAQEKPQRGRVLAVGPGKRLENGTLSVPDVSVGDTVLYGKYAGTEVKLAGKDYVILRAEDVLGVLMGGAPSKKMAAKPTKPVAKSPARPRKEATKKKAAPKAKPAPKSAPKAKPKAAAKGKSAAKAKPAAKPQAAGKAKPGATPKAKPAAKAKKTAKKGKK